MTITYLSTRGQSPALSFADAVLAGLAPDGGLYVPETLPLFSPAEIASFAGLSYPALAERILWPFVEGTLAREALRALLESAYGGFRHAATAPLAQIAPNRFVLELFHGPTLAFKDFALQFLGPLLDHLLRARGERAVVVGATSGDTGSAAIAGCGGRDHVEIFILHPHGRTSDVQRRQMTTILADNVHNIALSGTFDDCQDIVKSLFADAAFRTRHRLVAVNSINWARILAQIVYYFYAAVHLGAPHRPVSFAVPTGNFGDIYAGHIAKRMGLPVHKLIIASNRNDILTRVLSSGAYAMDGVVPSLSPSMDIQVSSNFERLLFDLHGRDGKAVGELMQRFRAERRITLNAKPLAALRSEFAAHAVSDEATLSAIRSVYETTGILLDPHTAVGVVAGAACHDAPEVPLVMLATAHPAKFPEAVARATGVHPPLPPHLADLFTREERFDTLPNDATAVQAYIEALAGRL
jgi:threonine synthase